MCGISGVVGQGWTPAQLEAMVSIQNHRGPDDSGIYITEAATVGLGHNRLSIIDLSATGHQPMCNHDGTLWIVFNGEIYNYLELRAELSDYPYSSQADTEVILAAYERWGEDCVQQFIGMFAFAIWDSRRQALFCARDRVGIKPFHYAWYNDCFWFASEIKAILAVGHPVNPNMPLWSVYLVHGYYDHSSETFFAGVFALPPGHTLTLADGELTIRNYWDLPRLASEPLVLDDDAAAQQLLRLFEDAVRLRLRSDVPLGVNLSGGLDSSGLMVTLNQLLQTDGELQTFTASFSDPRYDENEFASEVAHHMPWKRHIQRLHEAEVWEMAWEANWHQEAPYGGIATLAYYHLHRLAQECGVKVLLEGQGADEMLGGYNYVRPAYYLDLVEQRQWQTLRHELRDSGADYRVELKATRTFIASDGHTRYQDGTSHLRSECVTADLRTLVVTPPQFDAPFKDHLTNMLYRDFRYTKLPRVLRMNDRLSMAFSRELRETYLDHRLAEFAFRLPGKQKIRLGQGKFLLRHAMRGRLPDSIRSVNKRGVVTPQREWLRTALRPQVEEIIYSHSFKERGLFDSQAVQAAYQQFCEQETDNAFYVWQWVNCELWFRMFVDVGLKING